MPRPRIKTPEQERKEAREFWTKLGLEAATVVAFLVLIACLVYARV